MKYIEFMQYSPNELHDKQPVLINLEQVAKIYPSGNMTCVSLAGEGEITILRNDYEEVIRRISEVNDKQFCLDRKPTAAKTEKPTLNQRIKSAEAIYTGGGQWEFAGELEDGSFFKAFDSDWYEVHILDEDTRTNYDESCTFEWLTDHTIKTFCEDETETLNFFDRLYRSFREDDFIDRNYHLQMLENYRSWCKDNG